jgi:hypothetical protein
MKRRIAIGLVVAVLLGSVIATAYVTSPSSVKATAPGSLVRVQSGLAVSDPLNRYETQQQLQTNSSYWQYGGTSGSNSSYFGFFEAANQLHIGVTAATGNDWAGYYAVTPPTNASLVHATLTSPSNASVSGYYDIGLYMQASDQLLNYLACVAITGPSGVVWGVVHAQGLTSQNATITPLWVESGPHQGLSKDCTMVTNGQNSVRIYLDNVLVYQNTALALNMAAPYRFFIEDESLVSGQILYGQYQNFYATSGSDVTVSNLPSTAKSVSLVSPSGHVYLSSPVSGGRSTFDLGNYTFPVPAYLKAYSTIAGQSNATLVAYTPRVQQVYGGDSYSFGGNPAALSSLSIQAEDLTGHDLNGQYVSITQDRATLPGEYMPWTFMLNDSKTYTITAFDYGSYVFDHWSDGSSSRVLTISVAHSTSLVAYYRDKNAPAPAGKSFLTVSAVDSHGAPIAGLTVSLWQNGVLQQVSYTPASFLATPGVIYAVAVSGYGSYSFTNWSNGPTTQFFYTGVGSQSSMLEAVFTNVTS